MGEWGIPTDFDRIHGGDEGDLRVTGPPAISHWPIPPRPLRSDRMLIALLRFAFVTLATVIGLTSGQHFYRNTLDGSLPPWFGGAMGFGVSITLIAAEHAFRRHFSRGLVGFLIGLGAGLLLAYLLLSVLHLVIQDENIYNNIDLPVALLTVYLVLITVLRNIDRLRVVIPFVELRAERSDESGLVLDAWVLADGRLVALISAGLLPRRLLVHRRVLLYLEEQASGADVATQTRARRALETLAALRALPQVRVEIDETEIPNASSLADVVIRLARLESARLIASERDILSRAAAEGLTAIDLQGLGSALSPMVRPGEVLTVAIDKAGEGRNQGVGYLDDGSMVIVADAAHLVGQRVRCTILRLHQTANGRMVFAEPEAPPRSAA